MKERFYLTTTIPYVNGDPHIGHALEYIQADCIARYQRLLGKDVFFLAGTDENSLKNVRAAEQAGKPIEAFVAEKAAEFFRFKTSLHISFDGFIRTTEERHVRGAQKLWSACNPDDMYKKRYSGLYCVGCEMFYTEDELENGVCPEHKTVPDVVEEENYFFRLSRYQEKLYSLIDSDTIAVCPEGKKNEMLSFIRRGLEDFSISRSKARAHGWGVPVVGDEEQIMYVWFDALANYISGLNFGGDELLYQTYWLQHDQEKRRVLHVLGKGVARFHEVYWIAMLLSANLPLPTEEFVHGYVTVNGEKMSKSLGNVINPHSLVEQYGIDPVRYYFLGAVSPFQDGDFSHEKFQDYYTGELVNGVGNLVSRILSMVSQYHAGRIPAFASDPFDTHNCWKQYHEALRGYAFHKAVQVIGHYVAACDVTISESKPWEKVKQGVDILPLLYQLAEGLRHIALMLLPIIPQTAKQIFSQLGIDEKQMAAFEPHMGWGGLKEGSVVEKKNILFPKI